MLAVGAGLAPQHGRRHARQRASVLCHTLAVALHLQLLQVGRVPAQRGVIRSDAAAGEAVEIAVPDIEQTQAHRQVLRQWRGAEMLVHGMRARKEISEALGTDRDGNRQANGRPQRVAAAHPVPETKGGGDAEGRCSFDVGGERRKVAGYIATTLGSKPRERRARVGHGLGRGEGFGRDQEQRALGTQALEHMVQLVPVHVRHKVKALAGDAELFERTHGHVRAQVRPADADVHHVGDGGIAAHLLGVLQHGVKRVVHIGQALRGLGHITVQGHACRAAQQRVQHGAVFGGVDGLASKHRIAVLHQAAVAGQVQQQRFGIAVPQVLGQVGKHMRGRLAEGGKPLGVLRKRLAHVQVLAVGGVVGGQLGPQRRLIATERHGDQTGKVKKAPR